MGTLTGLVFIVKRVLLDFYKQTIKMFNQMQTLSRGMGFCKLAFIVILIKANGTKNRV